MQGVAIGSCGAAAVHRQVPPPPPARARRLPAAAPDAVPRPWRQQPGSRRQAAVLAAASSSNGNGSRAGELPQPTPQEMADAQAALKDFVHGLGSGGRTQRPTDMPEARMTRAEAASLVGMAGWRLHDKVCPAIETLAAQVEALWTSTFPEDKFGLLDLEQRFKYLDSLDPDGKQEMVFAVPDPPCDSSHYPRLQDALPPQCDPVTTLTPRSIAFLGPARSKQIGDIEYNYHLFGNTTGKPPLVMIMGMGATQYAWPLSVLEEISKTRRVLIFDNALTGLSVDTKATQRSMPLTIPFMAASTVELIKSLNMTGISKPDLLGYSLGGMIAQTIAGSHSDAVGAVVSVASSYAGRSAPQPEGGIDAMLRKLTSEEASDPTLMFPLGAADPAYCNFLNDVVSLQFAVTSGWQNQTTAGYALDTIIPAAALDTVDVPLDVRAKQAAAVRQNFAGYGTLPRLATATNQILFIGGSRDVIFPIATQSKAAAAVPESWLITVPDAGHGVIFQHPDLLARQVLTFLDSAQSINPDSYAAYYAATNAAASSTAGSLAIAAAAAVASLLALA